MPALAFLVAGALIAQEAKVTPLMSRGLAEFPGKEGVMITVVYPPGASDPVHRHNAHAFVYVLEGSIVMQLRGGKEITLTPGQTFYEGPNDIHTVGRNASSHCRSRRKTGPFRRVKRSHGVGYAMAFCRAEKAVGAASVTSCLSLQLRPQRLVEPARRDRICP